MLARPHLVLGWLHCQPEDSRRLLDRQLTHRDHALEADPSFSGMPASFVEETWVNWLPKAVAKPFYRDQLTAHVAELERQITNLSREIDCSPAACSIKEMQLWISDIVSSVC